MKTKTDFEILADKNINALRSTMESQAEMISNLNREVKDLKTGMTQINNNFDQFKSQVQIMVAAQFGSGPTKR